MLSQHNPVLGGQEAIYPSTTAIGQELVEDASVGQFPRSTFPEFIGVTGRSKSTKMPQSRSMTIPGLVGRNLIGQTSRRHPIGCFNGMEKALGPIRIRQLAIA